MPRIRPATGPDDLDAARRLFEAYARALPFTLDFQGFREELAALPGRYAAPGGCILLAEAGAPSEKTTAGDFAGCVALRPLAPGPPAPEARRLCEMKRLYVRPAHRERGVGRALAEAIVEQARRRSYDAMRLDTVASMRAANALYRALGFREIEAYRHNPLDEPVFFEKRLDS